MQYNYIKAMLEEFTHLAKEWEAEIASLSNALASLSALAAQSTTDAMAEYVQQLEQQLAGAQQAYGLLQTLQGIK